MPTHVEILSWFHKQSKALQRKYPSVTTEVRQLVLQLMNAQRPGQRIPRVGFEVYKVRLPNRAARRGKSSGFRVIYYVQLIDHVTLFTIYSKTDETDISVREIQELAQAADDARSI